MIESKGIIKNKTFKKSILISEKEVTTKKGLVPSKINST